MATATIHHPESPALRERLLQLSKRTHHEGLCRIAERTSPLDGSPLQTDLDCSDLLSMSLMNVFKTTGDAEAFALLFELNSADFLRTIRARLRNCSGVDANDVLQDAFVNMFRYPSRFDPSRPDAFRNWGHRIVRNTTFASIRGLQRQPQALIADDEFLPQVDTNTVAPELAAANHEIAATVDQAWLLFLSLYLVQFGRLSQKEQRALTLVEVEGNGYRETAAQLGVCIANLKMVIFRARKRVARGIAEALAALDRQECIVASPKLAIAG